MSLLFMEGFDHYTGLGSLPLKGWTSVDSTFSSSVDVLADVGRGGGGGLRLTGTANLSFHRVRRGIPRVNTPIIGARVRVDSLPDDAKVFLHLGRAGRVHFYLRLSPSGTIQAYRSTNSSSSSPHTNSEELMAETVNTFPAGGFHYVEFKITGSDTAGSFELRVDGQTWLAESGINTVNPNALDSDFDWIALSSMGTVSANHTIFDDVYVLDTNGTANNDFLGDVKVTTVLPNADGTHIDLTPSAGTDRYALVDEVPPNEDTDYLSSSTLGHKGSFGFPDLPGDVGPVLGVQASAFVKKEDAGHRAMRLLTRIDGADHAGSEQGLSTEYHYLLQLWQENPALAAAWTEAAVNGAEFGVEIR